MDEWKAIADELGGTYKPPETPWYQLANEIRGGHIEAIVDGVPVAVDDHVVLLGNSREHTTRVMAGYRFGPGPEMTVAEEGFVERLQKFFGAIDIEMGHDRFDKRYRIRAERPAVARRVWSEPLMTRVVNRWTRGLKLSSNADWVSLVIEGLVDNREALLSAIGIVVELAGCDIYGVQALREVGTIVQRDRWPRAELDVGVRVVVGAEDRDGRLVMAARAEIDVETIEIVDGKFVGAALPPIAHQVGTGTLSKHGFVWHDLELEPARLRAGAELLGAIAAARGGVYR